MPIWETIKIWCAYQQVHDSCRSVSVSVLTTTIQVKNKTFLTPGVQFLFNLFSSERPIWHQLDFLTFFSHASWPLFYMFSFFMSLNFIFGDVFGSSPHLQLLSSVLVGVSSVHWVPIQPSVLLDHWESVAFFCKFSCFLLILLSSSFLCLWDQYLVFLDPWSVLPFFPEYLFCMLWLWSLSLECYLCVFFGL